MSPYDPVLRAGDIRATSAAVKPRIGSLASSPHMVLTDLDEDDELWGSRAIAREAMLNGHGCTGKDCRKRAHAADWVAMHTALVALGLRADDRSATVLNDWGVRRQDRLKPGD